MDQNILAVETLKRLGLRFEFGFILFEASTTFAGFAKMCSYCAASSGMGVRPPRSADSPI